VKSAEEANLMLEYFDLTRSLRAAAELAGVSHHTVGLQVAKRDAGRVPGEAVSRERLIDPFLDKVEEWVERSRGRVRADVAHDKLRALGYEGSERTTRRAVAEAKARYQAGHRRVFRPWVVEPGMWFLCGIPHRNQYEEPGTMRNGGLLGDVVAAQGGCDGLIDST
jgi:hypothetical protein